METLMPRRTKGAGSLRLRGRIWWITYYAGGRAVAESSGSPDREKAANLLKQRIGEIAMGRDVSPEKATIDDLCSLVIADYKLRKLRDLKIVQWRYEANVRPAIGSMLASRFGNKQVREYVAGRRLANASDTTINRELSIVRRGFALGSREEPAMVRRAPHIPKLEEDNARQGFLQVDQYLRLLGELPERLKALFVCAYHVGTRKGELRKIRWDQVDLDAMRITFRVAQTKGKEARAVPIYGDMEQWLRAQFDRKPEGCPWVFYHHGRPVGAQLRGWREACERAEVPDLLFHDLRRSAVRNMTGSGVPRSTAMKISGHKTEAIFRRYDIVDQTDISNAAEKMGRYLEKRKLEPKKLKRVK